MVSLQKPSRSSRPKKRKRGKDKIVYKVVKYVEKDNNTSEQTHEPSQNRDIMWNEIQAKPFEVTVSPPENDTESIGSIDETIPRSSSYEMLCSYLNNPSTADSTPSYTNYTDSTTPNNLCHQKFDEYTIKILHKARDKLVSDSSEESGSNISSSEFPRFSSEDKHKDITILNQGTVAEKIGEGLFRNVRLDTSIPHNQWTYFEMKLSPVHGNETGFIGLSTSYTPLDQQLGLNTSSLCIGANGFVVYDREWNEIEAEFYDDKPNIIGCLCKITDSATDESSGVTPVDVLFYVNGEPISDVENEIQTIPIWFRLLLPNNNEEVDNHSSCELYPTATLMSKHSCVECITDSSKLTNPCPTEEVFGLDGQPLC